MFDLPTLSPEQQEIHDLIKRGENLFISGPAGVGKSLILKTIKEDWTWLPVTGTTGLAAYNVGGVTIHSWAGLGILEDSVDAICHHILRKNPKARKNIQNSEAVAIDEVSFLSAAGLDKIDQIFRKIRRNDRPFGGIQMILFGDHLQIPPVSRPGKPEGMAFEAECWKHIKTRTLTKIFRQEDSRFARVLNHIRIGNIDEDVLQLFRDRRIPDPDDAHAPAVIIHTHNAHVDSVNHRKLDSLPGKASLFRAIDKGSESVKAALSKHATIPTELQLKIGARVMLGANLNQKAGLVNGATGFVVDFTRSEGQLYPFVRFDDGISRLITPELREIKEGDKTVGSRNQIPLRLAWALTAHKVQGQTLNKIRVHLAQTFDFGQAYVAMSRVKTVEGLFIADGGTHAIKSNPKAISFYKKERERKWLEAFAANGDVEAAEMLKELR